MKISTKTLGIIAMLCAPGFMLESTVAAKETVNSSLGGFCDFIYMTGWMCSVVALMRLHAAGYGKAGKTLLAVQLAVLSIANIWNLWVVIDPHNNTIVFHILDMCWPLSNVCYLVTGIAVARAGVLKEWCRYIVFVAGLWLPLMLLFAAITGKTPALLYFSGIYTVVVWALVGYMIYCLENKRTKVSRSPVYPLMSKV